MSEIMTGGQAVIRTLARFGVDTVFGLPVMVSRIIGSRVLVQNRGMIASMNTRNWRRCCASSPPR